jgi:hypothetical protein
LPQPFLFTISVDDGKRHGNPVICAAALPARRFCDKDESLSISPFGKGKGAVFYPGDKRRIHFRIDIEIYSRISMLVRYSRQMLSELYR